MAIKHGTLAAPTGITATGTLIHQLETTEEDTAVEVFDETGAFETGKSLRKKTSFNLTGESLSTAAFSTVGSGDAGASTPHIDSLKETEKSEGAADFAIAAHSWAAGEGDYA